MWGFTRQEQRAILFLLSTFIVGALVWWYRQNQPPPAVDSAEVVAFEDYAKKLEGEPQTPGLPKASVPAPLAPRPAAREEVGRRKSTEAPAPLDLNAATYEELLRLPGIGPVMAKRILEYRETNGPFKHLEELKSVKGIGAKTYQKLARLLVIK
jgi:competence ComEA-like helix-hairpin-helix protein